MTGITVMTASGAEGRCCVQMDPAYEPDASELRVLFGLRLQQQRNGAQIHQGFFSNVVSKGSVSPPATPPAPPLV